MRDSQGTRARLAVGNLASVNQEDVLLPVMVHAVLARKAEVPGRKAEVLAERAAGIRGETVVVPGRIAAPLLPPPFLYLKLICNFTLRKKAWILWPGKSK